MSIYYDYEHVYNHGYMNLYITDKNQELLRQEESMSGLVNHLLEDYYNGLSSNGRTEAFEASNSGSSPDEPAKIAKQPAPSVNVYETAAPMGFACCLSKTKRCPHWEHNDLDGYWLNKLTGEAVDD